jgi:hypothetical protein
LALRMVDSGICSSSARFVRDEHRASRRTMSELALVATRCRE